MKLKLSKRTIDKATYQGPGADYRWDTELPSFGLRVYPSGRKSFVVTYRVRGKQRFYTLGRFGEITLQEARTLALETLGRARRGEDPAGERLAGRTAPTIADLAERYMNEHARVHKKPSTIEHDEGTWRRAILPQLGKRKVVDICRADIAALHSSLASTPGVANNARGLLSKAFNLAEVWGWRPEGSNPVRHVKRYRIENRKRFLSESELARLTGILNEAEIEQRIPRRAIIAVRLLILTGCRRGEILNLRWRDVDFEARCLRLPDSKTGAKVVKLNAPALEVLGSLESGPEDGFLFAGARAGRPLNLTNYWLRIRKQAGLEDVRIHDLRHTFASWGVNAGLSLPLVGKLLGHSQTATTERYAHLADDPVREANEKIGASIAAAMGLVAPEAGTS